MYGYIYLIYCTLNNKMYIGARKWNNPTTLATDPYMGSGVDLRKDMEKYGKRFFIKRILAIANSLGELNRLEKIMIERFNAVENPRFYNLKGGGGLHPQSRETKQKIKWARFIKRFWRYKR